MSTVQQLHEDGYYVLCRT